MPKSLSDIKQFFKDKRVLVTGHTGFKGAWLAEILLSMGAKVAGVSLRPHTNPNLFSILEHPRRVKNYFVDIRDFAKLKKVLAREKPEIVFHLAAQALVRTGYDTPRETHEINIMGTANVLEAICATKSVRGAVIVTTDKVYAPAENSFYKESDPLGGHDPYSASKAAADLVAQSYIKSFFNGVKKDGTLVGIARAGNVIGGGDWGQDRIIVDLMRSVYEIRQACNIRNPEAVRPWQHVFEPLMGYLMLGRDLAMGKSGASQAWNFGPEKESHVPVKSIVEHAIAILGQGSYRVAPDGGKPEVAFLKLDPAKAKEILGWTPKLSLAKSLRLTCAWYEEFYKNKKNIRKLSEKQIKEYFG